MKQSHATHHEKTGPVQAPRHSDGELHHPLQRAIDGSPRQRAQKDRLTQWQDAPSPAKANGLPSPLRTGIEALSGMDMGDVTVHRNSSKPAQLNALAYAQGNDIHLGPGQEKHLPHEAWHVVQQAQGRVRATTQLRNKVPVNDDRGLEREADVMGENAMRQVRVFREPGPTLATAQAVKMPLTSLPSMHGPDGVLQGVFLFAIDTDDYTLYETQYFRVKGKYLTGNSEHKHVTADSVKDHLWTGMEGLSITAFVKRLLEIVEVYENLPGVDLAHAHKLEEDEDADVAGINGPMRANYKLFSDAWDKMSFYASNLSAVTQTFQQATEKDAKDAAAFHIQNNALALIKNLDRFRDLMPLVNVISGLQKRGSEREAKAFLEEGKATKHVKNTNDALWAFFDFAAIDELADEAEEGEPLDALQGSIPWLDLDKLKEPVMANTGKDEGDLVAQDYIDAIAGVMLVNHIRLTRLSYPTQAATGGFGTTENVLAMLKHAHSPVNHEQVARYATGAWDFFK